MSALVRLRPAAQADLDEIWDYTVQEWSQDQAVRYLTGIGQVFDRLAEFPDMARLRTELTPPVRIFPYRSHVILYQGSDEGIDVIRVVHGRANWVAYLSE